MIQKGPREPMLGIRIHIRIRTYVFGPPGSASGLVSHKYGYSSGSFQNHAKIIKKTLISSALRLRFGFLPVFRIRIWIRIRRIRMFLGIPDPHPDPFVRGTDPRIRIRTNMSRIPTNMSRISNTNGNFLLPVPNPKC